MKKYQRYILGSLALLSVIALIVFIKSNKKVEDRKKTEIKTIMIDNMFATYEHINRELTMDYFYALDNGTTYQKIEEEIGKPNGGLGFGLVKPYYQVGDQYVVMWFSLKDDGEYDKLLRMCQYTNEKNIKDIPLKNAD